MRCVYRLSLTATFPLYPDTSTSSGVGRSHSAVNPQPPLVFLSPQATKALRDNRFVNGSAPRSLLLSPLSHTDGHVLPPTEVMPPTSQVPGTATLILRLRRYAHPWPRCVVRRCTYSATAVGQPLHSLRVCLRLRATAGRHIVLVQAHDKAPVAPCLRDTCRLL